GPTVFDRDILALDMTRVFQALAKSAQALRVPVRRCDVEKPDHRHRGLLRPRRKRPHGCPAEERDELASFHSITSSAATSSLSGTGRPGTWAFGALMPSSNLVACTTGRPAGLAPWRMRPAKTPT